MSQLLLFIWYFGFLFALGLVVSEDENSAKGFKIIVIFAAWPMLIGGWLYDITKK